MPAENQTTETKTNGGLRHAGHRFLYAYLIIILMALVAGAIYAWQHEKVKDLERQTNSLNSKNSELRAKAKQQSQLTKASGLGIETNLQQIHRVASAYLNRIKGAKGDDTSAKFTSPHEQTVVDASGKFAIQVYCGPGECSTMTLKKVGHTWVVLDVGLATQERHNMLIKDYDWPPNFISPQAQ